MEKLMRTITDQFDVGDMEGGMITDNLINDGLRIT